MVESCERCALAGLAGNQRRWGQQQRVSPRTCTYAITAMGMKTYILTTTISVTVPAVFDCFAPLTTAPRKSYADRKRFAQNKTTASYYPPVAFGSAALGGETRVRRSISLWSHRPGSN